MSLKPFALFVLALIIAGLAAGCRSEVSKSTVAEKPADDAKAEVVVCPVMGTEIPDVTRAAASSEYNGKTYYFCCPGCKAAFDKNPEKYADNTSKDPDSE